MPTFFDSPIPRRTFLKSALAGATILALKPSVLAADDAFHVALISDTHIPADATEVFRKFNPVDNLKKVVPEIVEAKPELTIHCGDLARTEGKVEDYQQIAGLLQPVNAIGPVCMTLGNHDDRVNFNTVFKAVAGEKQTVNGKNVLVLEHAVARFVVLDSLMYTNKSAGQLGKGQRAWLAKYLASIGDRPTVIFVHHTLEDGDGDLVDAERLFEAVKPHAHVKAIFFGHSHVWSIKERQNLQLINLPAVGYNFGDKEPVGWVDARFSRVGVELTLRALGGNMAENGKKFDVKWA